MKIATLGPKGTFSELAARKYKNRGKIIFCKNIAGVFDLIEKNKSDNKLDVGIVPLENMLDGSVGQTLDLLYHSKLRIIKEIVVPVHHCLASLPSSKLENIRIVLSHPKALAQCSHFLNEHNLLAREALSTAEAAHEIREKKLPDTAAICTGRAAKLYNLNIIKRNIEDNKENVTRFIVISRKEDSEFQKNKRYKTSIAIHPSEDRPGLLHDLLEEFSSRDINLTKIESRPTKFHLGEYIFYIDFEGHEQEKRVVEALKAIKKLANVRVFGSYKKVY